MEDLVNEFWRDKTVFVTGATGLLGSWLTRKLIELKANVVCLIRDWVPQGRLIRDGGINKVSIVRGDVRDYCLLEEVINEYEIEVVFHLAAQTIVGTANRNPLSTLETNVQGTWNVLEASRRSSKIKSVIVASSDKAYGSHGKVAYGESFELKGRFPYDVSKSCADLIAQSFAKSFDLPVGITRCGNLFGGGDLNWNRIVPGTIRSILRDEQPIIRSNGSMIRDYFYVEDAVEAYLLLARKMMEIPGFRGEAFNFSHGREVSVIELVSEILAEMESFRIPIIQNKISNEIQSQILDSSKAKLILDWEPKWTLNKGLKETVKWYREFFNE